LPDNPKGLQHVSITREKENIDVDIRYISAREYIKERIVVKQGDIIGKVGKHRDDKGNHTVITMYNNNKQLYLDLFRDFTLMLSETVKLQKKKTIKIIQELFLPLLILLKMAIMTMTVDSALN
jgi:hypothetical protein